MWGYGHSPGASPRAGSPAATCPSHNRQRRDSQINPRHNLLMRDQPPLPGLIITSWFRQPAQYRTKPGSEIVFISSISSQYCWFKAMHAKQSERSHWTRLVGPIYQVIEPFYQVIDLFYQVIITPMRKNNPGRSQQMTARALHGSCGCTNPIRK